MKQKKLDNEDKEIIRLLGRVEKSITDMVNGAYCSKCNMRKDMCHCEEL